jgi:hypothetical protein
MMRIALALVALLATHDIAAAKCAMPSVGSAVLSSTGAKLAAGGGILVGSQTTFGSNAVGAENAINKTWRFSDGTKQYEPVLVTLAPGLVVYQPPTGVTGALKLVDGKTERATLEVTADAPALLAAPDLRSVVRTEVPVRYGGSRFEVTATFKAGAPKGTVAVVVLAVTKQGNVARSWTSISEGAKSGQVAGTAGRCDPGVPGEVISKVGEKVVLAWVDASGRLGAMSKPIVVKRGVKP